MSPTPTEGTARLLVQCPDRPGIVAAVSSYLARQGANIVHADQHSTAGDPGGVEPRGEGRRGGGENRRRGAARSDRDGSRHAEDDRIRGLSGFARTGSDPEDSDHPIDHPRRGRERGDRLRQRLQRLRHEAGQRDGADGKGRESDRLAETPPPSR
ncbi:MAG: ACT domain-containing protein [Planctomycetes bacterium]|nr:ACT domain-containing protein [Planctomycetota bacterium]